MEVELNKKVVEIVEGVTLTLDMKEAAMLLDLVGHINGGGVMRTFTDNLHRSLAGRFPREPVDPFSNKWYENGPMLRDTYKPSGV